MQIWLGAVSVPIETLFNFEHLYRYKNSGSGGFLKQNQNRNRYTCRKPINCQTIFWSGFFLQENMDLGLTRVDLLQVSVTHPKTTKLLPTSAISEKAQQKVLESKLFLILKKKQHLICILGCCRRSRGSITSVFLPERRNSPYLQDFARTRDHPFGAGRSSRWDNSISGYYTGLIVDYSVASKPTTTS